MNLLAVSPKEIGEGLVLVLGVAASLALVVAGVAYMIGTFRRGRFAGQNDTAHLWENEAEALKAANERLQGEVTTLQNTTNHQAGQIQQLSTENGQLKALIMGEQLPNAMRLAFDGVVQQMVAEFKKNSDSNLQSQFALLKSLETDYLEPIRERLMGGENDVRS